MFKRVPFRKKVVEKKVVLLNDKPIIQIYGKEHQEIFRIEQNGDVFWLVNGLLKQAKLDNDLSLAFVYCVIKLM